MLKRAAWILCLASVSCWAAGAGDAAIEKAERQWGESMVKNDFAALDKELAEDLTYRHSTGAVDTKTTYIDKLKKGTARYFSIEYVTIEPKVISPTVAIAFCQAKMVTLSPKGEKDPSTLNFLHVFRKKGNQWELVAHQSSRMPSPAAH